MVKAVCRHLLLKAESTIHFHVMMLLLLLLVDVVTTITANRILKPLIFDEENKKGFVN